MTLTEVIKPKLEGISDSLLEWDLWGAEAFKEGMSDGIATTLFAPVNGVIYIINKFRDKPLKSLNEVNASISEITEDRFSWIIGDKDHRDTRYYRVGQRIGQGVSAFVYSGMVFIAIYDQVISL